MFHRSAPSTAVPSSVPELDPITELMVCDEPTYETSTPSGVCEPSVTRRSHIPPTDDVASRTCESEKPMRPTPAITPMPMPLDSDDSCHPYPYMSSACAEAPCSASPAPTSSDA